MGKTHKCVGLPFSHASTVLRQEFTETTENLFWGLQILFISNHMCTLKLIIFILFLKTIYCHCEAYCERERSWDLIQCPKKQPVPQVIISFLSLLTTFSMLLCLSRWTTILFFSTTVCYNQSFKVINYFFMTHDESVVDLFTIKPFLVLCVRIWV